MAKGKFAVNIELKVPDIEKKVINLVKKHQMTNEIIVSSFLHETLRTIKDIDSEIKTFILLNQTIENPVEYALELKANGINPLFYTLELSMIEIAHSEKLVIYPWTVNFEDSIIELIIAGVDGIITDFPDVARRIIDSTVHSG